MRGHPMAAAVSLLLAVGSAACSNDDETSSRDTPTPATAMPTTSDEPTAPVVSPSAPAVPSLASPQASPAPPAVLQLRADGLAVPGAGVLAFGSEATAVTDALGAALGPGSRQNLAECGVGPRAQVSFDGLSVLLDGDTFTGWTEQGSPERDLRTADGIGLQTSKADVAAIQPDTEFFDSSLGPEFFSETGVSGLLEGDRVSFLYAGETCFFR